MCVTTHAARRPTSRAVMNKALVCTFALALASFTECTPSENAKARERAHEAQREANEAGQHVKEKAREAGKDLKRELDDAGQKIEHGLDKAGRELKKGMGDAPADRDRKPR